MLGLVVATYLNCTCDALHSEGSSWAALLCIHGPVQRLKFPAILLGFGIVGQSVVFVRSQLDSHTVIKVTSCDLTVLTTAGHTVSPVLCVNDPEASVFTQERQEHVASSSPCLPHAAAAAAAATPSPVLPISTDAQEPDLTTRLTLSVTTAETPNDNVADAASVAPSVAIAPATEEHDRVAQALREGFLGAAGAIAAEGEDKSQRDGDAAAQQPGSAKSGAQDKPPAGMLAKALLLIIACFVQSISCFVQYSMFGCGWGTEQRAVVDVLDVFIDSGWHCFGLCCARVVGDIVQIWEHLESQQCVQRNVD